MDRDELVRRACNGDLSARHEIGNWLYDELRAFHGRRFRRAAVDDLIQDTMVDVWTKAPEKAPRTADAFLAWVLSYAGMTVFKSRHEARREAARAHKRQRVGALQRGPTGAPSPASELRRQEERQLLERCMQQLPTIYRVAVQHRFDDGRDADLAAREGIAEGTIRARVSRGLDMLERLLRDARVTRTPNRS